MARTARGSVNAAERSAKGASPICLRHALNKGATFESFSNLSEHADGERREPVPTARLKTNLTETFPMLRSNSV